MQLGMIGLGRMGANMAERLMKAGHGLVVYDSPRRGRAGSGGQRRRWRGQSEGLRRQARQAPRRLAHAPGRGRRSYPGPGDAAAGGRRHRRRRRQLLLSRRHPAGRRAEGERTALRRCRRERRRLGQGARLLPHDRRRSGSRPRPRPDFPRARARRRGGAAERRARTTSPNRPNRAICTAARMARATSSKWSTTASNTASWRPMRKA